MSNRKNCPECNKPQLPFEEQPAWGTHAFSVKYTCGSQIVVVLGQDCWEWEVPCPLSDLRPEEVDDGK